MGRLELIGHEDRFPLRIPLRATLACRVVVDTSSCGERASSIVTLLFPLSSERLLLYY